MRFLGQVLLGLFLSAVLYIPVSAESAYTANSINSVGVVSGPIWYSKSPVYVGEQVRIYSGVFNNREETIFVNVQFLNSGVPLGKDTVLVPPKEIGQVSVPWTPSKGMHQIQVKITEAVVREPGRPQVSVSVEPDIPAPAAVSILEDPENSPNTLTAFYENKIQAVESDSAREVAALALPVVEVIDSYIPERIVDVAADTLKTGQSLLREADSSVENKREDIRKQVLDSRVATAPSAARGETPEKSFLQEINDTLVSFLFGVPSSTIGSSVAGVAGSGLSLDSFFKYLFYILLSILHIILSYQFVFLTLLLIFLYYVGRKIFALFSPGER